jgi:hypothetical protein
MYVPSSLPRLNTMNEMKYLVNFTSQNLSLHHQPVQLIVEKFQTGLRFFTPGIYLSLLFIHTRKQFLLYALHCEHTIFTVQQIKENIVTFLL